MSLVNRVKDILLKPQDTWQAIESEAATPQSLYTQYLMILAAIPAVCSFIGTSIVGFGGFGLSVRIGVVAGLANMVVSYIMSLVMVYVLSLIINALAPSFGGEKNPLAALKLAVYGATATMVGGVFGIIPIMGLLSMLCGLYSIYLMYLGLPVIMKNPKEKSLLYIVVILLAGFVLGIVVSIVSRVTTSALSPSPFSAARGGDATFSMKTPDGGELKIDTAKLDAMNKKLEAAQQSGDPAAAAAAARDAAATMAGGDANVLPLSTEALKPFLPPQIANFKRTTISVQSANAMGIASSNAEAEYQTNNRQSVSVTISDFGGMSGLVRMSGSMVTGEKDTPTQAEKTWQENGRTLHQEYHKDGSHAALKVILKNGIMLELKAQQVNVETLRLVMLGLDLNGLENAQRPKKS